ncbi:plakophilin-1 [Pseudorasbora parva]|uniref:plakophilin-1 n=1 Tax=Pseudorasbora parva TaxID=51549 RepID=UPI00351DC6B1
MTAEPIRSALGSVSIEDTSLVLPSDKNQRTGQQRVLEQVNSIKRSKSKMVRSDSIPSPTTPASVTEFSEPKFQFSPFKLNDTLFKFDSSMKMSQSRMTGRSLSARHMRRMAATPSLNKIGGANFQKPKERRAYTVRHNRTTGQSMKLENNSQVSASKSQTVTKITTTTKSKSETSGSKACFSPVGLMDDITLKEAVDYLSNSDENLQLCGASYIQHNSFIDDKAKQEICQLGGIPALIKLLKSDNSKLQQTAAGALRNMVFKDDHNKSLVKCCDGLEAILNLLQNTNEAETQKQLIGLLWNLSSADDLKSELITNALPLLTESILVPYNCWTDSNINKSIDPEVFHNATGCLRNLSCASDNERISMRNCSLLIDSLVTYVHNRMERGEPDDKSVENCVCILHNLSYQLEKEAPEHFKQFIPPEAKEGTKKEGKKSIFSPKSTKTPKEFRFPAMEKAEPKGVNWLYHQRSLQLYLSLLGLSQKEPTLEACCGALQNLTASKSPVSTLMSQNIIEKLHGLSVISPLLNSSHPGLQKATLSLVGNMSRVSSLRSTIAKEVLPNVSSLLSAVTPEMVKLDSSIATACRVMQTLMLADPATGKKMLNSNLIDSLSALSKNIAFDKAQKDAGVLLWSMWGQKDFQNVLKKQGMNKDTFINPVTATAYKLATDPYLKMQSP